MQLFLDCMVIYKLVFTVNTHIFVIYYTFNVSFNSTKTGLDLSQGNSLCTCLYHTVYPVVQCNTSEFTAHWAKLSSPFL